MDKFYIDNFENLSVGQTESFYEIFFCKWTVKSVFGDVCVIEINYDLEEIINVDALFEWSRRENKIKHLMGTYSYPDPYFSNVKLMKLNNSYDIEFYKRIIDLFFKSQPKITE